MLPSCSALYDLLKIRLKVLNHKIILLSGNFRPIRYPECPLRFSSRVSSPVSSPCILLLILPCLWHYRLQNAEECGQNCFVYREPRTRHYRYTAQGLVGLAAGNGTIIYEMQLDGPPFGCSNSSASEQKMSPKTVVLIQDSPGVHLVSGLALPKLISFTAHLNGGDVDIIILIHKRVLSEWNSSC